MNPQNLFLHLIIADIRRLKKYIPSIIVSVFVLLLVCSFAAFTISKHIYKEGDYSTVRLAYYVPDDKDSKYTKLATGMLANMQSMQETSELFKVDSIDEGYKLLESGDAMFFIIIPENFFSGILDSTNPKLDIIVKDNSSITSYISNELFLSFAGYLGTAQAAIYSMLDTVRIHGYSEAKEQNLQDKVNVVFLERTLNKKNYIREINATNEGSFSLLQFYLSSAVMLCLFFVAIILIPMLTGRNNGVLLALNARGINTFHIFLTNVLSCAIAIYIAFLPCYLLLSMFEAKHLNIAGLLTIIPSILIISVIISISVIMGKGSNLAANMILFVLAILLAYTGGGLIPHAMLPSIIQDISDFMPGRYIINGIATAIFKA